MIIINRIISTSRAIYRWVRRYVFRVYPATVTYFNPDDAWKLSHDTREYVILTKHGFIRCCDPNYEKYRLELNGKPIPLSTNDKQDNK